MAEKKPLRKPFSLHLNEEAFDFGGLTGGDFAPATNQEKENFIQDRPATSYWKDAWRRMRKNTVAMVALVILVCIVLFAFVGPMVVPYGYDEFNSGAENLHPWHYSLEDQLAIEAAMVTPEQAVEQARKHVEAQPSVPSSLKNRQIVAHLYAQGIFNMKSAVDLVAEAMGISKNTVYLHLRHTKQGE